MTTTFATLKEALAALTADVQAEKTVIDGAVTLIQGIPQLIATAVDKATAAGADPATLAAFGELADSITAESDALSKAVATAPTGVQPAGNAQPSGSAPAGNPGPT